MKNCVLVTSVIAPSAAPLSYSNVRSVYSNEERYLQTLETLDSIKRHIPETDVAVIECSPVSKMLYDLSTRVDVFLNMYPNEDVRKSPHKGVSEAHMVLAMLNMLDRFDYQNIFKFTGRYILNSDFDYGLWDNNDTVVKETQHYSGPSIHTFLYKFNRGNISKLKEICSHLIATKTSAPAEQVFYNHLKGTEYSAIQRNVGVTARWSCYNHVDMF